MRSRPVLASKNLTSSSSTSKGVALVPAEPGLNSTVLISALFSSPVPQLAGPLGEPLASLLGYLSTASDLSNIGRPSMAMQGCRER